MSGVADLTERERIGREALISLADKGRRDRIILGLLWDAVLIYHLVYPPRISAVIAGAGATVSFLSKSPEEKALQRYLEEVKQGQGMGIRLGIDPWGGGRIVLVLSF